MKRIYRLRGENIGAWCCLSWLTSNHKLLINLLDPDGNSWSIDLPKILKSIINYCFSRCTTDCINLQHVSCQRLRLPGSLEISFCAADLNRTVALKGLNWEKHAGGKQAVNLLQHDILAFEIALRERGSGRNGEESQIKWKRKWVNGWGGGRRMSESGEKTAVPLWGLFGV